MSASFALLLVNLIEIGPAVSPPVAAEPPGSVLIATGPGEGEFVFRRALVGNGSYHVYVTRFDDDGDDAATVVPAFGLYQPHGCPLEASLKPLGRWLAVLLALGLVATILGSVGAARRPLPIAASAARQPARPVSLVERLLVLVCLWSPLLMLLGLLQAQHSLLASVLLATAGLGAGACAMMISARHRLQARLRWALTGRLDRVPDGTMVSAEVDPKRLVAPPGVRGAVPWYRADLTVSVPGVGEPSGAARIALDDVLVDDDAARVLLRVALGKPAGARLTVLGLARRAPADAASAGALDRGAPTQARIGAGRGGRALLIAGSPSDLSRRLRVEAALLAGALAASVGAALLAIAS